MSPKIILYLRLSLEDGDLNQGDKDQSNSIINQKNLLLDFVERQEDLNQGTVNILEDDGYSGTNQNRPNFKKLLEMSKKRQFDVLIVKDFSRFARDHIVACDCIDQIFPFLGIRFISVNDHYDSAKMNGRTSGIDIWFRNIIYSYYSEDLSKKVKTAKRTKAKKGRVVSGKPPFGYQKGENSQYLIEPVAAKVVQYIFELAVKGMPVVAIAKQLNKENIPTKSMIKLSTIGKGKADSNEQKYIWKHGEVYRILNDEQYLGKLVYGKTVKQAVSQRKQTEVPKNQWIVVDNAHEPLVTQEIFHKANQVIPRIKSVPKIQRQRLFKGKLKCGVCRHALYTGQHKNQPYYCKTARFMENTLCEVVVIQEGDLIGIVFGLLKKLIDAYVQFEQLEKNARISKSTGNKRAVKSLAIYKDGLEKLNQKKADLYEQWIEEKIDSKSYQQKKEEMKEKGEELRIAISEAEKVIEEMMDANQQTVVHQFPSRELLSDCLGGEELTREMVESFVDCIYVYPEKRIEIDWNFKNPTNFELKNHQHQ